MVSFLVHAAEHHLDWWTPCIQYLLVSCACHNKLPRTWWFETTEIDFFFTTLEYRRPKSRHRLGCFLLEALRENLFHVSLLVPTGCQRPLASLDLRVHYSNPRFGLLMTSPSVFLSCHFSVSREDSSHWILDPPSSRMISSRDPYLLDICKDSYSKYGHMLRFQVDVSLRRGTV